MSQHNIIGSEAFEGKRYIIVRNVRGGVGRSRRRRSTLTFFAVAVIALVVGALVAVFALAPLWMSAPEAAQAESIQSVPAPRPSAEADTVVTDQTPLRLQPVGTDTNRPVR